MCKLILNMYLFIEHYFFEASGKGQEDLFSYRLTMRLLFFNFVHIVGEKCIFTYILTISNSISTVRCLQFAFWIMYLGGSENPYFPIILVGLGICKRNNF